MFSFVFRTHDSLFYSDQNQLPDFDRKDIWALEKQDCEDSPPAFSRRDFHALKRDTIATYLPDFHAFLIWFVNTHDELVRDVWSRLKAASSVQSSSSNRSPGDMMERLQIIFIRIIVSRIIRGGFDSILVDSLNDLSIPFCPAYDNNASAISRMIIDFFHVCRVETVMIDGVVCMKIPAPQHLEASANAILFIFRVIFSHELVFN